MLRDDRQVAINLVVEALLEAAHIHEEGADLLEEQDLAAALRALAEQRRRAAQRARRACAPAGRSALGAGCGSPGGQRPARAAAGRRGRRPARSGRCSAAGHAEEHLAADGARGARARPSSRHPGGAGRSPSRAGAARDARPRRRRRRRDLGRICGTRRGARRCCAMCRSGGERSWAGSDRDNMRAPHRMRLRARGAGS